MAAQRQTEDVTSEESVAGWYLESLDISVGTASVELRRLPFRIGRELTNDLRLSHGEVSRLHAEVAEHAGSLWLRDCGSTNGTFVNRQRLLRARTLSDGDVISFGPIEFRLGQVSKSTAVSMEAAAVGEPAQTQTQEFDASSDQFDKMLRRRSVVPFFQPMMRLADGEIMAYEILGRCDFSGLPRKPSQALDLAEEADRQIELSELFREVGFEQAATLGNRHTLFLNAAPSEIEPFRLAVSLTMLRHRAPTLPLVLEINETAITNRTMLTNLRALLNDLSIDLAYDDFGVGQARLLEIIEVPPDWLKFDLMLVQSMRSTEQIGRTRKVLGSLVRMAHDLGIRTVAEGIENATDMEACKQLGFDFAQGFHIGRPLPFFATA